MSNNSGTMEMMIVLASATPKEHLLKALGESADEALLVPTEENELTVVAYCQMFLANQITKGDPTEASSLIRELKQAEDRDQLFTTGTN